MTSVAASSSMVRAERIRFAFAPDHYCIDNVSFELGAGELVCILGPNGAGKSTLLRVVIGLLQPETGRVDLLDRSITAYTPTQRARRIAYLPQGPTAPDALTVEELIHLGRHPHRGLGLFESPGDVRVVQTVMRMTQTHHLAGRRVVTLSGGEAQRAHLAAALAQQPRLLALDEPTASLDLAHHLQIFGLLRALADQRNVTTLAITHDINTARSYADKVLLLDGGRLAGFGPPDDVLTEAKLESVYHVRFASARTTDPVQTVLVPRDPGPVNLPEVDA